MKKRFFVKMKKNGDNNVAVRNICYFCSMIFNN